jgi:peptidoglycan/LPS O-acetylase OafA/YrhL
MECRFKFRSIAASVCLATLSGMLYADDTAVNLALPTAASFYTNNFPSDFPSNFPALKSAVLNSPGYLLAANEADAGQAGGAFATPATEFHPPWISGRKVHQYLGLSTVVLAGLTVLATPEESCGNCQGTSQQPRQTSGTTHTRLARATAAMAVATVMAGLLFHWNDIHLEDDFTDPDKLHARLAAAGALLMLYAVNKSEKSAVPVSHAAMAELGAAAMVVAIKLTW